MELSNEIRRIQSFPEDYPFALEILVEQALYVDLDGPINYLKEGTVYTTRV